MTAAGRRANRCRRARARAGNLGGASGLVDGRPRRKAAGDRRSPVIDGRPPSPPARPGGRCPRRRSTRACGELLRVELVGEQGQFRLQASAQARSTDPALRLGGQAADRPGRRLPRRRIAVAGALLRAGLAHPGAGFVPLDPRIDDRHRPERRPERRLVAGVGVVPGEAENAADRHRHRRHAAGHSVSTCARISRRRASSGTNTRVFQAMISVKQPAALS